MIPRGERLRARNETALALDNGTLNDPGLEKLLNELEPYRQLQEGTEDYYDIVQPKNKTQRETGKVKLVAKDRPHGMGESPSTMRALITAEQQLRSGRQELPTDRDISHMKALLQQLVVTGDTNKIGSLGARGNLTGDVALNRAAALLTDVDKGRDPKTGLPFNTMNSPGTVPLDAGHFIAHASRPDLSDDYRNIGFQNAYENRGQAHAEKMASQAGREATQEELADALFRSYINKIVSDVKLPRKNSKEFRELMDPINAKLAAAGVL